MLHNLNKSIFLTDWDKYAQGTYSDWEMAALCFYYHPHVLTNVNNERYGFEDFRHVFFVVVFGYSWQQRHIYSDSKR